MQEAGLGDLESDLQACCLGVWQTGASPLETGPSLMDLNGTLYC